MAALSIRPGASPHCPVAMTCSQPFPRENSFSPVVVVLVVSPVLAAGYSGVGCVSDSLAATPAISIGVACR